MIIKQILDRKVEKKKAYYLCWWKNQSKAESTLEPETMLREDGVGPLLDQFNEDNPVKPIKTTKKVTAKKVAKSVTAKTTKKIVAKKKK